jgi:hypothetical protein
MANFFDPIYDPQRDSASSAGEVSDLNPERLYDTDLRRVDPEDRDAAATLNQPQKRVASYMNAARAAGKYRQNAGISEPTIRGRVPRNPATIQGTTLPSLGDTIGRAGSTNYADRPQQRSGTFYGFG